MLELELPAALPERGETLFETTSTGLSLRGIMVVGNMAVGSPLSKPFSALASPATPTANGELELETMSTGSSSRGLTTMGSPLPKPFSELASPATPTANGELELDTMSTGFTSPWGTGTVCERASRERKVMKMENCILEVGNGGLL